MTIQSSVDKGVHIIAPEGCLDYNHALKLFEVVQPLVAQAGMKILIDLELVTMISSMGYVVLLQFIKTARKSGSRLQLCNLQGVARESLEIMRFEGVEIAVVNRHEALELLNTAI